MSKDPTTPATNPEDPEAFMNPAAILKILREFNCVDLSDSDDPFQFDEGTPFLVESAFLQYWNEQLKYQPEQLGLSELYAQRVDEPDHSTTTIIVNIAFQNGPNTEEVDLQLTTDAYHSGKYALTIFYNDVVFYDRTIDQDPATEWQLNGMANDPDVTDADGNMLFEGDPYNA